MRVNPVRILERKEPYLLHLGDIPRNIVNRNRIFHRQSVALTFISCLIHKYSCIRRQAFHVTSASATTTIHKKLTGERQADVIIQNADFSDSAWILELKHGLFLHT